jgi:ABC-type phosphate/phosphonate transport system substrate-binding protein
MLHRTVVCWFTVAACGLTAPCFAGDRLPLTMVVMDPLALPLSCPCVKGLAQRRYDKLGTFLEKQLDRPVKVLFSDNLSKIIRGETGKRIGLIVGKRSVVQFDARINDVPVRPMMMLTGKDGKTTLTGLIVVRKDDPAQKLADLKGYAVLFGPPDCDEKFQAAGESLHKVGIEFPAKPETRPGCSDSVIAMLENPKKPTAAVISSYAAALLEGCGTIEKGAIRTVGETQPVPFVTVFFTEEVNETLGARIQASLSAVNQHPDLLTALESKRGFLPVEDSTKPAPKAKPAAENGGGAEKSRVRP